MLVVGLDIGGANLKAATGDAAAADRPFPLWKHPERLEDELRSLLAAFPPAGLVAVTMTGELADGFASKADGVRAIVAAATRAAGSTPVVFWQTGGEFLSADEAVEVPRLVAAANWHALATFCGRVVPQGPGLLIDIGSTTTDLIPLSDGAVDAAGLTDPERLASGELVYTGASRTPVCALGPTVRVGDVDRPLAAELFATMRDVFLVLHETPEAPDDGETADGRPATIDRARARLARMWCADPDELEEGSLDRLAAALADRQRALIVSALEQVLDRIHGRPHLLVSGSGAFLARQVIAATPRLVGADVTSLADLFERRVSRSACAFAVARLASERVTV